MAIVKAVKKHVTLTGKTPILFDRYPGDNKTQLPADKKFYTIDGAVVLPALNVLSLFTAQNTESAPKLLLDPREYKKVCSSLLASLEITPTYIPFLRDGQPIYAGQFKGDFDEKSGMRIVRHVARLPKGIPNPKERVMLDVPWTLEFDMRVLESPGISLEMIESLGIDGGDFIGLGTFRKMFGKFDFKWQ